MNIENKTILITGANRGLGRALVDEALRRDAKRVYAGTRSGALQHADQRVTPVTLDVTSADQIQEAVEVVESLDDETAAETLEEMPAERQAKILGDMDQERAADILEWMSPDEAADVLGAIECQLRFRRRRAFIVLVPRGGSGGRQRERGRERRRAGQHDQAEEQER